MNLPLELIDIIILLPLVAMAIKGFKNGLIHEIMSLVGTALAIFISLTYMDRVGQILADFFSITGAWVPLLSFIALFIVVIVLVNLLIKTLNAVVKMAFLSIWNQILGAAFSAFKWALVFSVFLILLAGFNVPSSETRDNSLIYNHITPIAPVVYNSVATIYPGVNSFAEDVQNYIEQFSPTSERRK